LYIFSLLIFGYVRWRYYQASDAPQSIRDQVSIEFCQKMKNLDEFGHILNVWIEKYATVPEGQKIKQYEGWKSSNSVDPLQFTLIKALTQSVDDPGTEPSSYIAVQFDVPHEDKDFKKLLKKAKTLARIDNQTFVQKQLPVLVFNFALIVAIPGRVLFEIIYSMLF